MIRYRKVQLAALAVAVNGLIALVYAPSAEAAWLLCADKQGCVASNLPCNEYTCFHELPPACTLGCILGTHIGGWDGGGECNTGYKPMICEYHAPPMGCQADG